MTTHVAIAAAGSGGHVFPALAVADALRERGLSHADIVFFGGDRMEARTVPAEGYPFVGVDLHGIRRSLSVDNLRLPGLVRRARRAMITEMQRRGTGAVAVFGGYVSGPAALAARSTGTPLVIHEANAVPGVANRMVARRADAVFTSFHGAAESLPHAEVIGSPLRGPFMRFDRAARRPTALSSYGVDPDRPVLGVMGGSLGAQFLNDVAASLAGRPERSFSIIHITGPTHAATISTSAAGVSDWVTIPFEDSMVDFYAAADAVLSRGGALTIAELQATGTPAVVVPLPAGRSYQAKNAADLAAEGGAIVVPQTTIDDIAATVMEVMADPVRREAMRSVHHEIDHRSAAGIMADRILELADA